MIANAEALLLRASEMGSMGRYQLEAALQSAHVMRKRTGSDNWAEIVQLYDALLAISGSPVVAINRALAVAEAEGAKTALRALNEVAADGRMAEYQPYWAARAELLAKSGSREEAKKAYEIAIGLERDDSVRRFLQGRMEKTVVGH
jgi:RNA polymerase sigma-70 factor (ECF subfamily)